MEDLILTEGIARHKWRATFDRESNEAEPLLHVDYLPVGPRLDHLPDP